LSYLSRWTLLIVPFVPLTHAGLLQSRRRGIETGSKRVPGYLKLYGLCIQIYSTSYAHCANRSFNDMDKPVCSDGFLPLRGQYDKVWTSYRFVV